MIIKSFIVVITFLIPPNTMYTEDSLPVTYTKENCEWALDRYEDYYASQGVLVVAAECTKL